MKREQKFDVQVLLMTENKKTTLDSFINNFAASSRLRVRVTPKASRNHVAMEEVDGQMRLRVYVTVVPEDGKANKAVIALLSTFLKVPKSRIHIVSGEGSRDKMIEILDR